MQRDGHYSLQLWHPSQGICGISFHLSSSHEAHPLMRDESFSSLPYLLSWDLMFFVSLHSIKEPSLEGTFWVNFCCWSPSCPLPFFASLVLLPVGSNITSRLPFLHLVGQNFFTAITHSSGSFLAGGYSWLSSFLLPSSTLTLQRAHYICSFLWPPSLPPSSYFSADISLQILMPFWNKLVQALIKLTCPFLSLIA